MNMHYRSFGERWKVALFILVALVIFSSASFLYATHVNAESSAGPGGSGGLGGGGAGSGGSGGGGTGSGGGAGSSAGRSHSYGADHEGCGNDRGENANGRGERGGTGSECRGKECDGPRTPPVWGGGGGGRGIPTPAPSPVSPSASLTCTPETIEPGNHVALSWRCRNSTSSIGTNFSTAGDLAGSIVVRPTSSTIYQVACHRGDRVDRDWCRVNVRASTIIEDDGGGGNNGGGGGNSDNGSNWTLDISARPVLVRSGGATVVTWRSSNVAACSVQGPGLTAKNGNGSQSVVITEESTYTLTCDTDLGGGVSYASDSVTVRILPLFQEL